MGADTIRILIATDSHVGYAERDPVRKDDSWTSFDEVMQLAKTQDVCVPSVHLAVHANYIRLIWSSWLEISSMIMRPPGKQCSR
jgi:hypothetical protein